MRNKFQLLFILLTIIIFSFPSICFSESKTVVNEYCEIYSGDMKNKKELEVFRKNVRILSIFQGVLKSDKSRRYNVSFSIDDIRNVSQYTEKVVVISHTEKNKKICDRVKITFDTEAMDKYIRLNTHR